MGKFAFNSGQTAALESNRTGGYTNQQATSNQVIQAQQQAGVNPSLTNEEQAENLFRKFDLNNDGIITLDEFLEACHKVSHNLFELLYPLPLKTHTNQNISHAQIPKIGW